MRDLENQCIANALHSYLTAQLQRGGPARRFFRLDGFDEAAYGYLLDVLRTRGNMLAGQPLWIRTAAPISGYEDYILDLDKSATWYRNHVPVNHALVLIFNRRTSDVQSLKDIYAVTESMLSTEGLDYLIAAAFTDYQLSSPQIEDIKSFLARLTRHLFQPQLRDLVSFLIALNSYLHTHPGSTVGSAIAETLPYLRLFRCAELADALNMPKGDRLLRNIYRAAHLSVELLEPTQLNAYLLRLQDAEFDDDRPYGPSPEEKRRLLRCLLSDVVTDQDELRHILYIDWREVASVLHKKARKTRTEQLQNLGTELQSALDAQQLDPNLLPEAPQTALHDLLDGREPEDEGVEDLLTDYGDSLPKPLKNRLRRLRGTRSHQSTDFIVGVTNLATEMLPALRGELTDGAILRVEFNHQLLDQADAKVAEGLLAFRTVYGGIEQMMPSIQWDLEPLWTITQQHAEHVGDAEDNEEGEREKIIKVSLPFQLRVVDRDGHELDVANLAWLYRSDSTTAATLAHVRAEAAGLPSRVFGGPMFQALPQRLPIPIYNTCPTTSDVGDLDLSRPVSSLGAWYRDATDLSEQLRATLAQRVRPEVQAAIEAALVLLEEQWASIIAEAGQRGLLATDLDSLFSAYEGLLQTAVRQLQRGQEAIYVFRVLTQAWVVGTQTFDEWAVIPFLHPLKLHWWRERTRCFDSFIARLLSPMSAGPIVNERRFRQELSITYSSAGYPAVLALPGRDRRPDYFLPVHEVDGYELFRWVQQAGVAYGLDPEFVSEDEGEQAAQVAARELAHVVQDYIETYPYVRDGLEIYLVQCRNGSLPGLLVEQLDRLARGREGLRLSVIVHSIDRGAPLYQRVTEWLVANEAFAERPADAYFPPVSLKVLQCSYDELFQQINHTDVVILPDVLAEKGQSVEAELQESRTEITPLAGYLPVYRAQQAPFERGELTRDMLLTPLHLPALVQQFYNIQWAARERKPVPTGEDVNFWLQISLQDWEHQLAELHRRFNWVVCYDTTVDRFLLENTFPESIEVIRYSLGLGVKRRHNLTVSSSYHAQHVVVRRLTKSLETMLPGTPDAFREQVAQRLVDEAKQVSGDIVLRAAGPGAYLNELIGLVVAKYLTEQRYLQAHPGALTAWIYLDDFDHWFDRKFPDLLFVAVPPEANGALPLHIEVIETKCVGELSFDDEATDAQRQVAQGINRLAQAWASGNTHLDASYWYDQLYRAVVGNLAVQRDQLRLWEALRRRLSKGDFTLDMSGHAWIFCYDSSLGIVGPSDEGYATVLAPDMQDVPHHYHHFSRFGLREALRRLVEATWHIEAPEDTWSSVHDAPQQILEAALAEEPPQLSSDAAETVATVHQDTAVTAPATPTPVLDLTWLQRKAHDLERALRQYNIQTYPVDTAVADVGPSVVRFKVRLRPGEQLVKLQRTANDLARELALTSAPFIDNVLGTNFVGIDLPRPTPETVHLLPLLATLTQPGPGELPIILGQTPDGQTVIEDLSEFPHLLVAGATNSGKSVFLRSIVLCLMTQYPPTDLRLLIVDPKRTDFSFFDNLPYLPHNRVVTDREEARDMLLDLVHSEMPRRQEIMRGRSLRVKDFNRRYPSEALPPIVALIDEYAQLISIMTKRDREAFEQDLMSLAAVARSTGIHLILATQRPSADVVTGTLKANLPASIAFKVASAVNSRIVIDQNGAESLLGRGDMLFRRPSGELLRLQAAYIDEVEIQVYLDRLRGA